MKTREQMLEELGAVRGTFEKMATGKRLSDHEHDQLDKIVKDYQTIGGHADARDPLDQVYENYYFLLIDRANTLDEINTIRDYLEAISPQTGGTLYEMYDMLDRALSSKQQHLRELITPSPVSVSPGSASSVSTGPTPPFRK